MSAFSPQSHNCDAWFWRFDGASFDVQFSAHAKMKWENFFCLWQEQKSDLSQPNE